MANCWRGHVFFLSFASRGLHVMQLLQFNYSVAEVLISAFKLSQGHLGRMAYFE